MPVLHLKLTPQTRGINKMTLSNVIRSQNMTLQSVVINKPEATFDHDQIYVRLPFISSNQFHCGQNDKRGFLSFPTLKSTKGIDILNFNLKLDSDHVPETFEAELLDSDMNGITDNTKVSNVNLYFSYETHSLF
jgi:hypothetical protein